MLCYALLCSLQPQRAIAPIHPLLLSKPNEPAVKPPTDAPGKQPTDKTAPSPTAESRDDKTHHTHTRLGTTSATAAAAAAAAKTSLVFSTLCQRPSGPPPHVPI
ncbi:hypothetical protein LZ32DRAFT_437567 [Colletotrichum eremochloae]|nr:hypothetical protein LZ32DRAFT_437567 [Colletotrichum eremochloae]